MPPKRKLSLPNTSAPDHIRELLVPDSTSCELATSEPEPSSQTSPSLEPSPEPSSSSESDIDVYPRWAWVVTEQGKGLEVYRSRYAAAAEVKRRMEERERMDPVGMYMMEEKGRVGLRWSRDKSGESVRENIVKAEKARLF